MTLRELADLTPERVEAMMAEIAAHDAVTTRIWAEEAKVPLRSSRTWRKMEAAVRSNQVEELKTLLPKFLLELGLELPDGIVRPPRKRAGRPASYWNQVIYEFWMALGRPRPADLARKVFGNKDYLAASAADRKRMADLCAVAVKRWKRQNRG
jgi:hypothetical protein